MDRGRTAAALFALAACIACSTAAPTSDQTALEPLDVPKDGCYYNFQHYSEGDRIMTNEPCLNCTCHNRMLMCYLRVCPFTKPIGQDCTIEKRADQCCPIVTCPDVPVDLLTSTSTNSPAEYGATGLGKLDKYGCSINGKYFPEGSKVPPSPNKPCEHCYCIRNMTTCVMQECTLHVDGCTPIYHKDVCCPVRYSCDHPEDEIPLLDDMTTTVRPTPGFLLTTTTLTPVTQMSQDCVHDDKIFPDGALIRTEKACEHCYCMKGDIVCVVQECGTPMENEGKNCTSLPPRHGQCCPDTYICEGDDLETTDTSILTSELTTSPPRRVGVEGSGYRNEPDEPPVEFPTFIPDFEGSGEDRITNPPLEATADVLVPNKETNNVVATTEEVTKTSEHNEEKENEIINIGGQDKGEENVMTELTTEMPGLSISQTKEFTTPVPEYIHTTSAAFSTSLPNEIETVNEPTENIQESDVVSDKKTTISDKVDLVTTEHQFASTHVDDLLNIDTKVTTSPQEYTTDKNHYIPSQEMTTELSQEPESSSVHEHLQEQTISNAILQHTVTETSNLLDSDGKVSTQAQEYPADKDQSISSQDITTESSFEVSEQSSSHKPQEENRLDNAEEEYTVTKTDGIINTESKVSTPANEYVEDTEQSMEPLTTQSPSGILESSSPHTPQEEQTISATEKEYIVTKADDMLDIGGEVSTPGNEPAAVDLENVILTHEISTQQSTEVSKASDEQNRQDQQMVSNTDQDNFATISEEPLDTRDKATTPPQEYTAEIEHDTPTQEFVTQPSIVQQPQEEQTEQDFMVTKNDGLLDTDDKASTPAKEFIADAEHSTPTQEIVTEPSSVQIPHEEHTLRNTEQDHIVTKDDSLLDTDDKASTPVLEYTANVEGGIPTQEITTQPSSRVSEPSGVSISQDEQTVGSVDISDLYTTTIKEIATETTSANPKENEVEEDNTLPISSPGRIPGEGDCLLNSVTYKNNSIVPSTNICHTSCRCISSIIKCDPIICSPPPEYMNDCEPIYDSSDSCCPTYICNTKETLPPQSHNQMSFVDNNRTVAASECNSKDCIVTEEKESTLNVSHCSGSECAGPEQICDKELGCGDVATDKCEDGKCSISPDKPIINETEAPQSECSSNDCTRTEEKEPDLNVKICSGDECLNSRPCDKENGCQETSADKCIGDKCPESPDVTIIKDSESNLQDDTSTACKDESQCKKPIDSELSSSDCSDESCKNNKNQNTEDNISPSDCSGSDCLNSEKDTSLDKSTVTSLSSESSTTLSSHPHEDTEVNVQPTEVPKYPSDETSKDFITEELIKTTQTLEHVTIPIETVTDKIMVDEEANTQLSHESQSTLTPYEYGKQTESTNTYTNEAINTDNKEILPTEKVLISTSQESHVTETYDQKDELLEPHDIDKELTYSHIPEYTTEAVDFNKPSEQDVTEKQQPHPDSENKLTTVYDEALTNEPINEIKEHITTESDEAVTIKQSLDTSVTDLKENIITTTQKMLTDQAILNNDILESSSANPTEVIDIKTDKYDQESSTSHIETPTTLLPPKYASDKIDSHVDVTEPTTEQVKDMYQEVTDASEKQPSDEKLSTHQDGNNAEYVTDVPLPITVKDIQISQGVSDSPTEKPISETVSTINDMKITESSTDAPIHQSSSDDSSVSSIDETFKTTTEYTAFETKVSATPQTNIPVLIDEEKYPSTEKDLEDEQVFVTTQSIDILPHEVETEVSNETTGSDKETIDQEVTLAPKPTNQPESDETVKDHDVATVTEKEEPYSISQEVVNVSPIEDSSMHVPEDKVYASETPTEASTPSLHTEQDESFRIQTTGVPIIENVELTEAPEKYTTNIDNGKFTSEQVETEIPESHTNVPQVDLIVTEPSKPDNLPTDQTDNEYTTDSSNLSKSPEEDKHVPEEIATVPSITSTSTSYITVQTTAVYPEISTNIPREGSTSTTSTISESPSVGSLDDNASQAMPGTTESPQDIESNENIAEDKIESTSSPITESIQTDAVTTQRAISVVTDDISTDSSKTESPTENELPHIVMEKPIEDEKPHKDDQENIPPTEPSDLVSKDSEKDTPITEPTVLDKESSTLGQSLGTVTSQPIYETDVTKDDHTYDNENKDKYTTAYVEITTLQYEDQNKVTNAQNEIKPVHSIEEGALSTTASQIIENDEQNQETFTTLHTDKDISLASSPIAQDITTKATLIASSPSGTESSDFDTKTTESSKVFDTDATKDEKFTEKPLSQFTEISSETQRLSTEPTDASLNEELLHETVAVNIQPITTDKAHVPETTEKDQESEKDQITTSEKSYPTTASEFVSKEPDNDILTTQPPVKVLPTEELKTPQTDESLPGVTNVLPINDITSSETPGETYTTDSHFVDIVSEVTTPKPNEPKLQSTTDIPSQSTSFSIVKEDESKTTLSEEYYTIPQKPAVEISGPQVDDQSSHEIGQDVTIPDIITEKTETTPTKEIFEIIPPEGITTAATDRLTHKPEEHVETTQFDTAITDKYLEESTTPKPLYETEPSDKINIVPEEIKTELPGDEYLSTVEPQPTQNDAKPSVIEENKPIVTEKSEISPAQELPTPKYESEKQNDYSSTTVSSLTAQETVATSLPISEVTNIVDNEVITEKQIESQEIPTDGIKNYDINTEQPGTTPKVTDGTTTPNIVTIGDEKPSETPHLPLEESDAIVTQSSIKPIITSEDFESSTTKSDESDSSIGDNLVTELPILNENQEVQGKPIEFSTSATPEIEAKPISDIHDISPSEIATKEPENVNDVTTQPSVYEEKTTLEIDVSIPSDSPVTENKLTLTTTKYEIPESTDGVSVSTETELQYSETTPYYVELEEHKHEIKDEDVTSKVTTSEEIVTTNYESHQTEHGNQATESPNKVITTESLTEELTTIAKEHVDQPTTQAASEDILDKEPVTESVEKVTPQGVNIPVEITSASTLKEEMPSTVATYAVQDEESSTKHTAATVNENRIASPPSSEILTEINTLAPATEKTLTTTTAVPTTAVPTTAVPTTATEKEILRETAIPEILVETSSPEEDLVKATTKLTTVKTVEEITTQPTEVFKPEEKPEDSYVHSELPKPDYTQQPSDEMPPDFPPSAGGYGQESDYVEEDQAFGPGTCRYGGKVYVSAQQIPRDDPCDFCFCFRSDIICLQQSCPPPIHGCHEEPIQGFCCPRYECPVSMATAVNITTTTTTTTTTLPPHFFPHAYKGAAQRRGCQIKGHTYKVGEVVRASSGPCLHCTCGGDGQMKCDPKVCTPEPMLRQMIAAAVSSDRRR